MNQQEFYLNQPKGSHECFKLPNRTEYLLKNNYLNEFFSDDEKAEARSNLGITPLLEELKALISAKLVDEAGNLRFGLQPTNGEEDENAYSEVLSSAVIYNTLLKYYTKQEIDEWRERVFERINNLKDEVKIIIDEDLDKDSTNPVQNKVISEALDALSDAYSRLLRTKADEESLNNYYSTEQINELLQRLREDFVSSLTGHTITLDNYYTKEQLEEKLAFLPLSRDSKIYIQEKIDEAVNSISEDTLQMLNQINELLNNNEDLSEFINLLNAKADNSRVDELENEIIQKLVEKANSSNVYTKYETYNRDEIDEKFSEVPRNNTVIVDSIPEHLVNNTTYLVKDPDNQDVYNQYIYVNGQLIQLKDKEIDLSNLDINGDCTYNSVFTTNDNPDDDNIRTTISLGNIPQGTSVSELSGKTMSELLDMILFKEEYPNPSYSHTISLNVTPSLVKQDSTISQPNVIATWNNNIISDNNNITTKLDLVKPDNNLVENWTSTAQNIYNIPGNWTWKLYHNYGEGSYNVTSNFGNLKEIIVPAVNTYPNGTNNPITKVVKVTKPILYGQGDNLTEAELYPINEQHSIIVPIGGQAKIVVPWENSLVTVEVDLGFGYMPIDGWTTTKQNGQIIMQKNDSYLAPVSHRITFTLRP